MSAREALHADHRKEKPVPRRGRSWSARWGVFAVVLLLPAPVHAVSFEDSQVDAGISFLHASSEDPNYPETTGSGVCWGDVDGDGTDDVFWVNGKYSNVDTQATMDPRSALYLNNGDGTFADVSGEWGADAGAWGQGCSFADYDGDADLDLLLVGYGYVHLFRNDADRFVNVTAESELTLEGKCADDKPCFGSTGAWADYDLDGDLDVYVTNNVDYDVGAGGPVDPGLYDGQANVLFRNDGDGTFTDVTAEAGVDDDPGPQRSKSFQSSWADFNRDGLPDLYIASDSVPNSLFRNNGDGTFTDVAEAAGVDDSRASMGLYFMDITSDALPDLYFTHYAAQHNGYYENLGDGTFKDRSGEGGLASDLSFVGWGTGLHDFTQDGRIDVYAVNGHTAVSDPEFEQEPLLWRQDSDGTFVDVSGEAGESFTLASVARGSAVADYDLDGDLDIALLANYNATARLLRQAEALADAWLQLEVREPTGMNRYAIGAEVTITPEGLSSVTRIVQAGNSFLSQDSLIVHAGLGAAAFADVEVRWPDGEVERWAGLVADQRVRLVRGQPDAVLDTLAPRTEAEVEGVGEGKGWWRSPVDVRVVAEDRGMPTKSGLARTEYALEEGAWVVYSDEVFHFAQEGVHRLRLRSEDVQGNREPARTELVRLDFTPPTADHNLFGTPGENGWWLSGVRVELLAEDAWGSVDRVSYRLNGGDWVDYGSPFTVAADGIHEVEYIAMDLAGNVGEIRGFELKIDRSGPRVRFTSPEPGSVNVGPVRLLNGTDAPAVLFTTPESYGLGGPSHRVTLDSGDDTSGLARVFLFLNGVPVAILPGNGPLAWEWDTSRSSSGVHRFSAIAVDGAGNARHAEVLVVLASATQGSVLTTLQRGPAI